ncbi:helix-hairpin-helix domain-containing protein [Clostridioides sp. ES-S-0108-01]|uniref:helix-hairpin-helix domain-containing protein n=1 Tax=Clostridioides sp. ES-S-0108-01 TaxID=2770773 RepID=UPI002102B7E5
MNSDFDNLIRRIKFRKKVENCKNSSRRKSNRKSSIMLGCTMIKSLKDANPAQMYEKECLMREQHIDRC